MADDSRDDGTALKRTPPTREQRIVEGIAWALGIVAVLFFGRAALLVSPTAKLTTDGQAIVVGTIVGAILIGLAGRWAWVAFRRRGRVSSPWIPLIAALLLALNLARDPSIPGASASVPIETYLKVGAPYNLQVPPADETARYKGALAGVGVASSEVREISNGNETVGYLLVANLRATSADEVIRGLERAFDQNEGAETHSEVIEGKDVVVGSGPQLAAMIWAEPPYGLVVYATDVNTGKLVAASIISAYK
jgi:hypothetical protein